MRTITALGAAVLLWAACPPAQAQGEPPKTAELEAATERFEAGKRLFREGTREHSATKIDRAYFEFKAAYAIYPARGTLLNLVETELASHRALDAMKHIREYVRSFGVPEEHSEYRRAFDTQSESAFKVTGHLEIAGPPAMRVVIDGKDEALVTPLSAPVDVAVGHHVVGLVGVNSLQDEADAEAGTITKVTFVVAPPIPPPPPIAPATVEPPASPPPSTAVTDVPPPAERTPFWTTPRVWGAVVSGVGLAAVGAGVAFALNANHDGDRASSLAAHLSPSGCYQARSQACVDLQSARDDQSRDHALNLAFVSVGAAAVVSAGALMLWPTPAKLRMSLAPILSPDGGELRLRGDL